MGLALSGLNLRVQFVRFYLDQLEKLDASGAA